MAIGKLNLKLGIDVSNLDKELGKVERSMSRFGSKMKTCRYYINAVTYITYNRTWRSILKSICRHGKGLNYGLTAIMGSSKEAEVELQKLRKTAENPGLAITSSCTSIIYFTKQ
jgi:hypothetical protein